MENFAYYTPTRLIFGKGLAIITPEMDATYPQRPHAGTFCEVQCGYLRFAPLTEKDIYEILEASL